MATRIALGVTESLVCAMSAVVLIVKSAGTGFLPAAIIFEAALWLVTGTFVYRFVFASIGIGPDVVRLRGVLRNHTIRRTDIRAVEEHKGANRPPSPALRLQSGALIVLYGYDASKTIAFLAESNVT